MRKNQLRGLVTEKLVITKPAAIQEKPLKSSVAGGGGDHTYVSVCGHFLA